MYFKQQTVADQIFMLSYFSKKVPIILCGGGGDGVWGVCDL